MVTVEISLETWMSSLDVNNAQISSITNALRNSKEEILSSSKDKNGFAQNVLTAISAEDTFRESDKLFPLSLQR